MSSEISSPFSNLQSPIFLVGFMASGKTTVGRALAERLGVPFVDLDEEIVRAAGCTIAELIQQEGEAAFRALETECLRRAATQSAAVISLGGGAFTQASNRALVSQAGVSIWLDAPFALCWERIQRDAVVRPLAATEEEARARFQQRIPIYEQAQVHIHVTDDSSPASLTAEILARLPML
ncbi:MAG TPA: shikimate kinase [Blastocatellia bacterium]|nr:shikimate kinase [Blastocatellia bacterium]